MKILFTIIQGILCGIANIIPGVSGGTFALILGIYERIIGSLRAIGSRTLKSFLQVILPPKGTARMKILKEELQRIDAFFFFLLGTGAVIAIVGSARLISFLLEQHKEPTLGFFIGLIIPSVLIPYRLLDQKGLKEMLSCVLGVAVVISLTFLVKPTDQNTTGLMMMFISGVFSITAMILPGISGSFVLMVLGEYKNVLDAVNSRDLVLLGVFLLGCLVGLISFVRLLDYLLKKLHSITMAFLIGLIMGSIWVLWPFKQVEPGAKFITGINILPMDMGSTVLWSLGLFLVGLVCSVGLNRLDRNR